MKTALLALFLLVVAAVAQAETAAPAAKHANGEHPAVLVARQQRDAIDPNRFIVAPPASTRWTSGPALDAAPVRTAEAAAR